MIYVHRYEKDTVARIRTDYVHEQQSRYRTELEDIEQRMLSSASGEKVSLKKKQTVIKERYDELKDYEEIVHHLADQMLTINMDDGIKYNYSIFQDILSKLK